MDRNVPTTTQNAWSWTTGSGSLTAESVSLEHGSKLNASFMTDLGFYNLAAGHRFLSHAVLGQGMGPACQI